MSKFVVVKSLTRRYGFSIQAPPNTPWATGPQGTFGWYRLKSDAQERADELNRASRCWGDSTLAGRRIIEYTKQTRRRV